MIKLVQRPVPMHRAYGSMSFLLRIGVVLWSMLAGVAHAQIQVDEESPWPRVRKTNGHVVTLHQPQVESWTSNSFQARSAVGVKAAGAKTESLGVIWLAAHGSVDRSSRLVTLDRFDVTKARFPDASDGGSNVLAIVRDVLPAGARTVSLDYLIAALGFSQAVARQGPRGLKHTPPEIIWVTNRTVLVLIDGEPKLKAIPDTDLQRVVNTPALMVFDKASSRFYLHGAEHWFSANSIEGAWSLAQVPPSTVTALAETGAKAGAEDSPPRVIVRTRPAELLVTSGLPDFRAIRGTALQFAADTDSQLFFHTSEREAYLLKSGRWFKAASLGGPWTHVAPRDLPRDFAKIPAGSPQGVVLASVPNTRQAQLAVLANSVPATATVNRRDARIQLIYDGEPRFKPIDGTQMSYAVNAQLPVILASGVYFALDNGVWFTAPSATGPWIVAAEVPEEIYTIPPSSPVYYATFAQVYSATDEEVEVGYTAGYQGAYEDDGTVVYGTGWEYEYWYEDDYYGWGWTWGYDYVYVPWYQWWLWRNWWDPPGGLRAALIENIYDRWQDRNGVIHHDAIRAAAAQKQEAFTGHPALYGRFLGATRPTALSLPKDTLALNPYSRPTSAVRPGEVPRGAQLLTTLRQSSGGGRDLYASPDGNIYRRRDDGWYRREQGGQWKFAAPVQGSLQRRQLDPAGEAVGGSGGNVYRPTAAPRDRPNRIPDTGFEPRSQEILALEREYYARSLAQFRAQNWDGGEGNFRGRATRGGRRR